MLRKLSALFIVTAILLGATSAWSADYKTTLTLTVAASSPTYDEAYTFTQPENLTITQSGWNSLGSITASYGGSNAGFDSSKKLVVTVTSTNTFALKAEGIDSTISYFHATSENDTSATTTFEFSAAEINATGGTSKAVGVNVADYSSAAAGTYTDEITYTVEVQDAGTTATVADMLTNGVATVVSATVDGTNSVSGTFTYDGSAFTASNVSGADSATASVNGSYVQFDFTIASDTYTVAIYPNDKTYVNGTNIALTSITVNGTEVFSTLTLSGSKS